ncbi:ankyrin repeat-containing protein [Corchorus capsularis]|uniref:Ankyrin repeat-containing protein n=1 Tax=Corchorus capsularis TaxID=210143 RepID=A0A1R3J295_COCAP|nr:ankyrin repeat-containing protein [Corchorus capsularis]
MKSLHEIDARNSGRQTVLEALQYRTDLDRRALVKILSERQSSENSDNAVNALLVVAGLILAAIFPYLNSPPGGFRAAILVPHLADRAAISIFLTFLTDMLISLVIFIICLLLPDGLFGAVHFVLGQWSSS